MSYALRRQNGTWQSFATADFESVTLTRTAGGSEQLRIVIVGRPATDEEDFLDGERVTFYVLGTSFFQGRAKRKRNRADASGDRREYVFSGAFEEFERRQLFGVWKNKDAGYSMMPKTFTIVTDKKPTVGEWLEKLVAFVENRVEREDGSVPWTRRTLLSDGMFDAPLKVPVEALGTMTFADALARAMRWIPDMTLWFRHWGRGEGEPPELVCNRAANRATFTARIGHDYGVGTAEQPSGVWTVSEVEETEGFAPRGVIIVWTVPVDPTPEELEENPSAPVKMRYVYERYPEAQFPPPMFPAPLGNGGGLSLVPLGSGQVSGIQVGDRDVIVFAADLEEGEDEAPPPILARVVYESLSLFRWQGSVEWVGEFPILALNPGQRLRITGADCPPEWATLDGFVDTVSHDLKTGRTSVSFGPPSRLGFADFRELLRFWRERAVVPEDAITAQTEGETQTYSFGANGAQEGFGRTAVYLNVNGAYDLYYVVAKKASAVT